MGFIEDTNKIEINNGAGCRLKASFQVNRVPGNFHISTHGAEEQPAEGNMA